MKKPTIHFHSHGPSGNIFWILSTVQTELKKQHQITEYNNLWEEVQKGDYNEALAAIRKVVDLIDLDGKH